MSVPNIAARVRHWRMVAGLTRAELAEAAGVDRTAVSHWESGRSCPSHGNLARVASACGVSMGVFWSRLPEGADGDAT